MRKHLFLFLSAAVCLLTITSCQKQGKWTKHTVTEEYVYVDGQDTPADEVSKPCKWTAKRMVKNALKEEGITGVDVVVPVKVGYYECGSMAERENLYKLQVNGLLNVTYSELKNKYEKPTYWVDVQLTGKGKSLIVKEEVPVFPEDTINPEYMLLLVNPETGLNQYGEYTFDPNVAEDVTALIKNFYKAYIQGANAAINQYGTPDLIRAAERIEIANGLGIRRLSKDPFVRDNSINDEAIDAMTITKWTTYVDLYVVTINGVEYCVVIKVDNGQKKIDDVALNAPVFLVRNKTMRCTAAGISARELHNALRAQEAKAARLMKAIPAKAKATPAAKAPKVPETVMLEFEEYNPNLAPGIVAVEHNEPTLYELAKAAENYEIFNLKAGTYAFKEMGKLKQDKQTKVPTYKAVVTIENTKVNALGRIFFKMTEGETKKLTAVFVYVDDEWEVKFCK